MAPSSLGRLAKALRRPGALCGAGVIVRGSWRGTLGALWTLLCGVREQLAKDVPEEEERDDDGDREEAEQNRVLGRRLAILALPQLGSAT